MMTLLFNPLVFSLLIKQLIDEVLEQLLSIPFLNVFEATVQAHEACDLVELAHPSQILPLLLKKLLKTLFLLLSAETSLVPLSCFLLVYELIEGSFSLSQGFQGLNSDIMGGDTLRIVPTPSGSHSRCF
jgi:hypothetical protein